MTVFPSVSLGDRFGQRQFGRVLVATGAWTLVQLGILLAGLLAAAVYLRRRIDARGVADNGKSIRLTAEHAVHVVDVRGKTYVIGTGPAGPPSLLSEVDGH